MLCVGSHKTNENVANAREVCLSSTAQPAAVSVSEELLLDVEGSRTRESNGEFQGQPDGRPAAAPNTGLETAGNTHCPTEQQGSSRRAGPGMGSSGNQMPS